MQICNPDLSLIAECYKHPINYHNTTLQVLSENTNLEKNTRFYEDCRSGQLKVKFKDDRIGVKKKLSKVGAGAVAQAVGCLFALYSAT